MAIEKIKILRAVLELPAKQQCQSSPSISETEPNGLNWQYCLAGSSKNSSQDFVFSIAMGADYQFHVKSIGSRAPTFFGYLYYFSVQSHCY